MDTFPSTFVATKIQSDVISNRLKKIEQDIKCFRQKIVQSFQGATLYHTEVSHELLPELSEDDQKDFYRIIKEELEVRGFIVKGKINNGMISLIIFSNTPRTSEMDKVLKLYSEKDVSLNLKQTPNGATVLSSSSTPDSNKDSTLSGHIGNDLFTPLSPRLSMENKDFSPSEPKPKTNNQDTSPMGSNNNTKRMDKTRSSINLSDNGSKPRLSKILPDPLKHIDMSRNIKPHETKSSVSLDMSKTVSLSSTGLFSPRKIESNNDTPKVSDDSNLNNTEIDMDFIKRKLSQAKKDKAKK